MPMHKYLIRMQQDKIHRYLHMLCPKTTHIATAAFKKLHKVGAQPHYVYIFGQYALKSSLSMNPIAPQHTPNLAYQGTQFKLG